ncbi:hypothetical protein HDU93_001506 [Gonapodya sp. JEL0774]|nr:hypothetical protein HDU93_001506 [Gonapodya sp. JEL0774]
MHRFGGPGERHIKWALVVLLTLTLVVPVVVTHWVFPFDGTDHPKHIVLLLNENVTAPVLDSPSGNSKWVTFGRIEHDSMGFGMALAAIEGKIGWAGDETWHERAVVLGANGHVFYPVSTFVQAVNYPYTAFSSLIPHNATRRKLGRISVRPNPTLTSTSTYIPATNSRRIQLQIQQEGIGWSALTFTADVVAWSLDVPLDEAGERMHVVRNTMGYGVHEWEMTIEVRCPENFDAQTCAASRIKAEFWGFDKRMWNVDGRIGDWGVYGSTDWFDTAGLVWDEGEVLRGIRRTLPDWVTWTIGSVVGGAWQI